MAKVYLKNVHMRNSIEIKPGDVTYHGPFDEAYIRRWCEHADNTGGEGIYQRSFVARKDIPKGAVINPELNPQ